MVAVVLELHWLSLLGHSNYITILMNPAARSEGARYKINLGKVVFFILLALIE